MKFLLSQSDEEKNVDARCLEHDQLFSPRSSKKRCSYAKYSLVSTFLVGISTLLAVGYIVDVTLGSDRYGETENQTTPNSQVRRLSNEKSQSFHNFSPQKLSADMNNPRVLNVHAVPHTHDDVGWLKTVDQYYYGLNNTIQLVSVKNILDTVVASLLEHENQTFTYVESKFFSTWWNEQSDAVKDSVRYLVANKQLSFSNGGWCMHDEAATHFMGMIDQTTLGHEFLKRELGVVPKVGWQLDPFGHSASQASLFTHKMGFDALFFGRMDYQERRLRQLQRSCEGLWNASRNLDDTTIFWGLTGSYAGNYGNPRGFCFDEVKCSGRDPPLLPMNQSELLSHLTDFMDLMRVQADMTQGNHIMITMGDDFHYQHASYNFANIDTLIQSITRFQALGMIDVPEVLDPRFDKINIFFSSPEYYAKCKNEELVKQQKGNRVSDDSNVQYGIKTDDFFPYADYDHAYWTGYFTSRPSLKRHERIGSSFLLAARQIHTMPDVDGAPCDCDVAKKAIYELEDALGVVQHHDGVSGTAKQHVANDYSKRLQKGIDAAAAVTAAKLGRVLFGANTTIDNLTLCQRLNETVCDTSQAGTLEANTTTLSVIVYNALAQPRSTPILLPVSSAGSYSVRNGGRPNSTENVILSIPSLKSTAAGAASYVLPLDTGTIPALGAQLYQVTFIGGPSLYGEDVEETNENVATREQRILTDDGKEDVEYSNGLVTAVFDGTTGELRSVTSSSNFTLDVSHEWGYYVSWDYKIDGKNENDKQNSGAYIFRPSTPDQKLITVKPKSAKFQQAAGFMEVHIEYEEPWIQTTYRILPGQLHLEVEYTVGPIGISNGRGKEVVSRFTSSIQSGGTFYTDSNGREFLQRRKNYRPAWDLDVYEPVAGNYYPVNAAIYVEDKPKTSGMAIAVDRSQGGASLQNGAIELMVHRRTLADDFRGVGEPHNETDGGVTPYPPYGNATRYGEGLVVRGKHKILVGGKGGASLARSMMDSAFADPFVFVGSSKMTEDIQNQASGITGLAKDLPSNVMLITRRRLTDATSSKSEKQFLIRLGHQYGLGEDEELSQPATVDLVDCLPGSEITGVVELTLSGNQKVEDWEKSKLVWTGGSSGSQISTKDSTTTGLKDTAVELKPMDIRTFRVTVKS